MSYTVILVLNPFEKSNLNKQQFCDLAKQTENYSISDLLELVSTALRYNIKESKLANHFIKIECGKYQPCLCANNTHGIEANIKDFPSIAIEFPKVSMKMMTEGLKQCKASVQTGQMEIDKFRQEHGDGLLPSFENLIVVENATRHTFKLSYLFYIIIPLLFIFILIILFLV